MRNDFMFDLQRDPDLAMVQIELPLGLSFMSLQTSQLPYLLWVRLVETDLVGNRALLLLRGYRGT